MDSDRFTIAASHLTSIQNTLRNSAESCGEASRRVGNIPTWTNTRAWTWNAVKAAGSLESARKKLADVAADLSILESQVQERSALLQKLIHNPFLSGPFGGGDPFNLDPLTRDVFDTTFFNPNRPPPSPEEDKKDRHKTDTDVSVALSLAGTIAVADTADPLMAGKIVAGLIVVGAGAMYASKAINNAMQDSGGEDSVSDGGGNNTADEHNAKERPPLSPQKQAGHVEGTPQYENRIKQGKPTSAFPDAETAEELTQEAWAKGTPVPGQPNRRDYDFGRPVGTGPNGGTQTKVRVTIDKKGRIHGHPVGPETPVD